MALTNEGVSGTKSSRNKSEQSGKTGVVKNTVKFIPIAFQVFLRLSLTKTNLL